MNRSALFALASLSLTGCVTNTSNQVTQIGQTTATGNQIQPTRPAPALVPTPQQPRPTPAALLSAARLITTNKTTTTRAALILASPASLTPDCHALGQVEAKIVSAPEHGTVQITQGMAFPNFSPGDPPYICNAHKSPATLITYRSEAGFTGNDTVSIQIFFPDGKAPTLLVHITVQ